jgi:hypothetical protein
MKRLAGLFIVGCLMLLVHPVQAHDGLRNAQGCHTDNDGTNYHCHETEEAAEGEEAAGEEAEETEDTSTEEVEAPSVGSPRTSSDVVNKIKQRAESLAWAVSSDENSKYTTLQRGPYSVTVRPSSVDGDGIYRRLTNGSQYREGAQEEITAFGETIKVQTAKGVVDSIYVMSIPARDANLLITAEFDNDMAQDTLLAMKQLLNPSTSQENAAKVDAAIAENAKKGLKFQKRCKALIESNTDRVTGKTITSGRDPIVVANKAKTEGFVSLLLLAKDGESVIWSLTAVGASACVDDDSKAYVLFTDGTRLSVINDADFNCDREFTTYYGDVFEGDAALSQLASKTIEILRVETLVGYVERKFSKKQADTLRDSLQCLQAEMK